MYISKSYRLENKPNTFFFITHKLLKVAHSLGDIEYIGHAHVSNPHHFEMQGKINGFDYVL